jgi:hypothetical protein
MVTGNARSRHSDRLISMVTDNSKHLLREAVAPLVENAAARLFFQEEVEDIAITI